MERSLYLLHELANPVIVEARPTAERPGPDLERLGRRAGTAHGEGRAEQFVEDLLEGAPGAPDLGCELRPHIIVER